MKSPNGTIPEVFPISCIVCSVNAWLPPQGLPNDWVCIEAPDFLDTYICNNCREI